MGGVHPYRVSAGDGRHVLAHQRFITRASSRLTPFTVRTMGLAHSVLPRSLACEWGLPLLRQEGSGIQALGHGREAEISAKGTVPRRQLPLLVAGVPAPKRS